MQNYLLRTCVDNYATPTSAKPKSLRFESSTTIHLQWSNLLSHTDDFPHEKGNRYSWKMQKGIFTRSRLKNIPSLQLGSKLLRRGCDAKSSKGKDKYGVSPHLEPKYWSLIRLRESLSVNKFDTKSISALLDQTYLLTCWLAYQATQLDIRNSNYKFKRNVTDN